MSVIFSAGTSELLTCNNGSHDQAKFGEALLYVNTTWHAGRLDRYIESRTHSHQLRCVSSGFFCFADEKRSC